MPLEVPNGCGELRVVHERRVHDACWWKIAAHLEPLANRWNSGVAHPRRERRTRRNGVPAAASGEAPVMGQLALQIAVVGVSRPQMLEPGGDLPRVDNPKEHVDRFLPVECAAEIPLRVQPDRIHLSEVQVIRESDQGVAGEEVSVRGRIRRLPSIGIHLKPHPP
jgi:hypothetical protein